MKMKKIPINKEILNSYCIVDVKPKDILSLATSDVVTLIYNTGESVIATFLGKHTKGKKEYYDFLINKNAISFKLSEVPAEYEPYTFSVNSNRYVLYKINIT